MCTSSPRELRSAPKASLRRRSLHLLGKHQVGAAAATLADFSIMVALVELAGAPAALASVGGAATGAIVHFHIGRRWIFAAARGPLRAQAARYALVSGASAALNGLGELVLHHAARVDYVVSRVVVAIVVGVVWNFPMQRRYVFHVAEASP